MTDDVLRQALDAFQLVQDWESENRALALDDLRFGRLGEQWPEEVRRQREREMRPCLTINRMPAFIRQVVNDARQNKPTITTRPVDDFADPETAEILNGLIRNIESISNADVAYDTAVDFAASMGFGYLRATIEYAHDDTFDQDIKILAVPNPFSIYGDPDSTAPDGSDWNSAFVAEWMTKKDFERQYKGATPVDWTSYGYAELTDEWVKPDNVMLAEWWTREEVARKVLLLTNGSVITQEEFDRNSDLYQMVGLAVQAEREAKTWKVKQRIMSGAEVLKETDWPGRYIPIVPVYGEEINVGGKRHWRSLIRDAKDPARMFNYWRTASTELVALAPKAPFIGPVGAFDTDADKWASANTTNHPYIEYDGDIPPQRQPFAGVPAGALQEALNASDDMKAIIGIYDPALGARSNETSGKAIVARKLESDTSNFHIIDNLSRGIRHLGNIVIDLIPHVYTPGRIVRTLGLDNTAQTAQLAQQGTPPAPGYDRVYDLTVGKYDVVVTAGPSYTTRREEAANQMVEFIRAFPAAAGVIGDLLAKNLDWPGADEIAQRLQAMQQAQQQPDNSGQAELAKAQADAQVKREQMAIDAQLQREKLEMDMALKREQLQAELALEQERLQAELLLKSRNPGASASTSRVQPGGNPG